MKETLLVIDVQKRTLAPLLGQKNFLQRINCLIDEFHSKGLPVILIRQAGCGALSSRLNRRDTDYVVDKSKPNGFTSAELNKILTEIESKNLVVTGLMSNSCVQETCKGALRNGYSVLLIEDAHDSIIKPLRTFWNKKLQNLGVELMRTNQFMIK